MSHPAWLDRGNTAYETELNELRRDLPREYASRPYFQHDPDHTPRFIDYGESKPYKEKGWKKIYATMCCGSGIGAAVWAIGVVVIAALIAVLAVKFRASHANKQNTKLTSG